MLREYAPRDTQRRTAEADDTAAVEFEPRRPAPLKRARSAEEPTPTRDGAAAAADGVAYSRWLLGSDRGWAVHRRSEHSGDVEQGALASAFSFLEGADQGFGLPAHLAARLGAELGIDATAIRLHTGDRAASAAAALGARAFAMGHDIYFAANAYDPQSDAGVELIAHEVAHVAQTLRGTAGVSRPVSRPDDTHERDADDFARRFTADARRGAELPPAARHALGGALDELGGTVDLAQTYFGDAARLAGKLAQAGAAALHQVVSLAEPSPKRQQLLAELVRLQQLGTEPANGPANGPRVLARGPVRFGAPAVQSADRGTVHRGGTGTTTGGGTAPDMSPDKVSERVGKFKTQDGRAKIKQVAKKEEVKFAAKDGARFNPRYYKASTTWFTPAQYAPTGSGRDKKDLQVAMADTALRLSKVDGMDAYVFTEDGDYKATVTEVTAQPKWKGYKKAVDAIAKSSGVAITFTWPKNGNTGYTEEDPGLANVETDDYRDAMRTAIAAAFKDKTGKWNLLYKHVVEPQHFTNRICGDIFEECVVQSAAELPNKFANPSLDQPVFDVATFPELAPGSNIKGDGTLDLKIQGDHVLIECKAYTGDPTAANKTQMKKYKKMLGKTGYKIKGAVQQVPFDHIAYFVTTPSDPKERQARLVKWHEALKDVFSEGEYSLVPAPTGLTKPFKVKFNPTFDLEAPEGKRRATLTNPQVTHPGMRMTQVDANFNDLGALTSGSVTYDLEAGDIKKPGNRKPFTVSADGSTGEVDNKLTGLTSKLGNVLKDAEIDAAIVDGGVEATIKINPGAAKGLAGFTVEGVTLKAKYSGDGAFSVSGEVKIKHQNGKINATLTVGYDNGWSFTGTATISDGFIPGVPQFTATVSRTGSGDWSITVDQITFEKQFKAIKLTGRGQNLTYDVSKGKFSGSASMVADLGMFGTASGAATIDNNELTSAELSYDSPELKYPAKSDKPAFKGTFGGTLNYDKGQFSGAVRGNVGLSIPALEKLAGEGGLGLSLDGNIHPDGHFTGTIASTSAIKLGKYLEIPSISCTIKDNGDVEGDFKLKVVNFKYLDKVEVACKVDKSGISISEAAVSASFGKEGDKFRGSLNVAFKKEEGLSITGSLTVKIKEGLVATGTLTYNSKDNKVQVELKVDEITLLKHGPVTKSLFKFAKQIPLVSVYGLGVYLDIGFNLDFNYEFDLRLAPKITLEDLSLETFEYKQVKAEIELLGQLAARLVATPKVGLGLFALSPSLLRGGGGVMIPITGEALLKPKGKLTVAYSPSGGASGDVEVGMALTFGIKGSVKPYAELSLLDGVWNPSWTGDSLADFEIMPPKELFNFQLDLNGDMKKQDPQIPDSPGAPKAGGGKQLAQEPAKTEQQGKGSADRNAEVPTSGPSGAGGGLPDEPVKLGSMTSGLKGLPGYQTIEGIMKKAGAAWEKIKGFFGRVAKAFKSFFEGLASAMEEIIDGFAKEGLSYLPKLIKKIVGPTAWEVIEPIITAVASNADKILELFETDPPKGAADFFPWALKVMAKAWGLAFDSIGSLVSAIRTMISRLGSVATKLVTKMVADGMIGVKRHTYWYWLFGKHYFFAATEYKIHILGVNIDFYDQGMISNPASVVGFALFEVLEQMGVAHNSGYFDDRVGEHSRDRWA